MLDRAIIIVHELPDAGIHMKLPQVEKALIDELKVTGYLLNATHEQGGSKAAFFLQFGFTIAEWTQLADVLIEQAKSHDVVCINQTEHGTKYIIEGDIRAPDGRPLHIRAVWIIDYDTDSPRLVTAYPIKGGKA
jgi:hypothetical protein